MTLNDLYAQLKQNQGAYALMTRPSLAPDESGLGGAAAFTPDELSLLAGANLDLRRDDNGNIINDNATDPDGFLKDRGYLTKSWMEGSWAGTPGAAVFGNDLKAMAEAMSPGGEWITDPNFGEIYKMNTPLKDIFGDRFSGNSMADLVKMAILGVGAAGLSGLLPGTTPAFGADVPWGVNARPEALTVDYSLPFTGTGIGGAHAGLGITPASTYGLGLGASAPASSLAANLAPSIGAGFTGALSSIPSLPSTQTGAPVQEGPTTPIQGPGGTTIGEGHTTPSGGFKLEDFIPGGKYAGLTGTALSTALGLYGASQQADAYKDLADRYFGMGAPYRGRLESLYADPNAFLTSPEVRIPVQQGTDALARALSAKVGNPIDNPTALQEIQNYASNQLFGRLGQEKDRLAGFGGLTQYNAAAPQAQVGAVGSQGDVYNVLGYGLNNIFNPRQSVLEQLAKTLKIG